MEDKVSRQNISSTIASGALVNTLGTIGKLTTPIFFVVITRLYGPDIMGTFYLVYTFINVAISF